MVKLHLLTNKNALTEVFQSNDIKFSFLVKKEEDYYQITTPAKCREYFNEFLMKNHHPKTFEFIPTHGFDYNWDKSPWDICTTYMSIKFPSAAKRKTFLANLPFLHQVEDFNQIERTVIEPCDQTNTLVILADSFWNTKCILMNVFTWILKLCSLDIHSKTFKELWSEHSDKSEVSYLTTVTSLRFNNLLSHLEAIPHIPSKYVDGTDSIGNNYAVHNSRGILAIHNSIKKQVVDIFSPDFMDFFKAVWAREKAYKEFLKEAA